MTTEIFNDAVEIQGSQDIVQLQVEGPGSQTANLQEWRIAGVTAPVARLTSDGRLQVGVSEMGTPDALIEANNEVDVATSPAKPRQGIQSRGRITGTIVDGLAWMVGELELLGSGGIAGIHTALRSKLLHNKAGDATNADLRAGDFEVVNQSGTALLPVGQVTGLQSTITNQEDAHVDEAVGVEISMNNAGDIQKAYGLRVEPINQATENYAIHTGDGPVHLGDYLELEPPAGIVAKPTSGVRLYPKADGKLYLYGSADVAEHEVGSGGAGDMLKSVYDTDNDGRVNLAADSDKVDGLHATAFALSGHNHDERYFQESEHITISAGTNDGGKPVKTNNTGKLDTSLIPTGIGNAIALGDLNDVGSATPTLGRMLRADGDSWESIDPSQYIFVKGLLNQLLVQSNHGYPIEVRGDNSASIGLFLFNNNTSSSPSVFLVRGRGTNSIKVPVEYSDLLGDINWGAQVDNLSFTTVASMLSEVDGPRNGYTIPTRLSFRTTSSSQPGCVEALRINSKQELWVRTALNIPEHSYAPTTPAGNERKLYAKADGWYDLDDTGTAKRLATMDEVGNSIPSGCMQMWPTDTAPSGWLLCYGQAVSRATYANLFAVLGSTFGSGDGTTTFNLPDMRGRFPLGQDDMGGTPPNPDRVIAPEADTIGGVGGAETHTLMTSEIPSHRHVSSGATNNDSDPSGNGVPSRHTLQSGTFTKTGWVIQTGYSGSDQAHNNMPPYLTLNYIIKA